MPGREYISGSYKFGFNGKEKDAETGQIDYGFRMYKPGLGRFLSVDPLASSYPYLTPYQFASNSPIAGIDLEGLEFYYAADGKFLGRVGALQRVYIADELKLVLSDCGDGTKAQEYVAINEKKLNIIHNSFQNMAATVYGESSHGYGIDNMKEIFFYCKCTQKNKLAYGANNDQAKEFLNTKIDKRNGTFMQTSNVAAINALTGGVDYNNGATMWDGKEQVLIDSDVFSKGGFEYHMNTMGWRISDEHYKSWKENIGSAFIAPQEKYTPSVYSKNKYSTANTISLISTAQYARTIFWKELRKRIQKPQIDATKPEGR